LNLYVQSLQTQRTKESRRKKKISPPKNKKEDY